MNFWSFNVCCIVFESFAQLMLVVCIVLIQYGISIPDDYGVSVYKAHKERNDPRKLICILNILYYVPIYL